MGIARHPRKPDPLPPRRSFWRARWYFARFVAFPYYKLRCRFSMCPGRVVTGVHDNEVWAGWRCAECLQVKHYAPTGRKIPRDLSEL